MNPNDHPFPFSWTDFIAGNNSMSAPPNYQPSTTMSMSFLPMVHPNFLSPTQPIPQPRPSLYSNNNPSQFPQYSTQVISPQCETNSNPTPTSTETDRTRYTIEEDECLISAWLNISKDPRIGTDQTSTRFWDRITERYNEKSLVSPGWFQRGTASCKNRFSRVARSVSRFVGSYENACDRKKSGESENDVMIAARRNYQVKDPEGKEFNLEHAWHMLKNEPKFKNWLVTHSEREADVNVIHLDDANDFIKRTRISEDGNYSSGSNASTPINADEEGDRIVRPMGRKAAKQKGKAKQKTKAKMSDFEDSILQKFDEIEKSDNDMRMSMKSIAAEHTTTLKMKLNTRRLRMIETLMNKKDKTQFEIEYLEELIKADLEDLKAN